MRATVAVLFLGAVGCIERPSFRCASDAECVLSGAQGTCEPGIPRYCSFADARCPSGRRFGDLAGPYAGQCVGAGSDTDGDLVEDDRDNCPEIRNPAQGNEDNDRFGDACDPCPPIEGDDPPDRDGDTVADACDPNPDTIGDAIAVFEGFHEGVPAGWERFGTWTRMGDDVVSAILDNVSVLATPAPMTGRETVSASVTIDEVGSNVNCNVGIIDQHLVPPPPSAIACEVYRPQTLALVGTDAGAGVLLGQVTYPWTTGATYVMSLGRGPTSYTCSADQSGNGATVSAPIIPAPGPYSAGLRARCSRARYHWMMVVRSP